MAKENITFGQTPKWAIQRFHERNKIEIVVFTVICLYRFRATEIAEMDRAEIIRESGLDKAQVSRALTELKSLEWIEERSKTEWFVPETKTEFVKKSPKSTKKIVDESSTNISGAVDEMTTNGQIVDESSTNDQTKTVDEMTTPVDESSTICCQNDNNVRAFKRNSDIHTSQTEIKTEESLSPHAPAREENSENPEIPERVIFGDNRREGISVATMMNFRQDPDFLIYTQKILEGLNNRHGTKARLPNCDQWVAKIENAWHNEFSAEQCLEVYDLLNKILTLRDGHWIITPKYWEENIPRVEKLRHEVKKLEKGGKKDGTSVGTESGKSTRRIFSSPNID